MSHNIKTIHATASIEKAAIIMKENNIKKLPVILNNEIVGIITETDILRAVYAFSETIEHLTELYDESRKNIGNMMDKWGSIITNLKNYKDISNKED
jgi:predicted transcriptional regulator